MGKCKTFVNTVKIFTFSFPFRISNTEKTSKLNLLDSYSGVYGIDDILTSCKILLTVIYRDLYLIVFHGVHGERDIICKVCFSFDFDFIVSLFSLRSSIHSLNSEREKSYKFKLKFLYVYMYTLFCGRCDFPSGHSAGCFCSEK